ncbi:hypothetical protein H4Q26_012437 [Puccinia striiformis f. sp. tritici PST-130]|nr:hypothetical protein H4Q26_012437 [Puccinia striiformis f. sp. tritici PST-130]
MKQAFPPESSPMDLEQNLRYAPYLRNLVAFTVVEGFLSLTTNPEHAFQGLINSLGAERTDEVESRSETSDPLRTVEADSEDLGLVWEYRCRVLGLCNSIGTGGLYWYGLLVKADISDVIFRLSGNDPQLRLWLRLKLGMRTWVVLDPPKSELERWSHIDDSINADPPKAFNNLLKQKSRIGSHSIKKPPPWTDVLAKNPNISSSGTANPCQSTVRFISTAATTSSPPPPPFGSSLPSCPALPSQVSKPLTNRSLYSNSMTSVTIDSVTSLNHKTFSMAETLEQDCNSSLAPRPPFFWNKIHLPDQNTAWNKSGIESPRIDLGKLCQEFSVESVGSDTKNKEKSDLKNGKITTLLELNRANHIAILLASLKLPNSEIKQAILSLEDDFLSLETLKALRVFSPSAEEIKNMNSFTGDLSQLASSDQYFLSIKDIPRLQSRICSMIYRRKFESEIEELEPEMKVLEEATQEVRKSKKLKTLLSVVSIADVNNSVKSLVNGIEQIFLRQAEVLMRTTQTQMTNLQREMESLVKYFGQESKRLKPELLFATLVRFKSEFEHTIADLDLGDYQDEENSGGDTTLGELEQDTNDKGPTTETISAREQVPSTPVGQVRMSGGGMTQSRRTNTRLNGTGGMIGSAVGKGGLDLAIREIRTGSKLRGIRPLSNFLHREVEDSPTPASRIFLTG